MKTRLQTYTNMELLFLPVLRLNERSVENKSASEASVLGAFVIPVNAETEGGAAGSTATTGVGRNTDGSIKSFPDYEVESANKFFLTNLFHKILDVW